MDDRFGLTRFLHAQQGVYGQVVAELHDGRKRSHWMWFVFPQIEGLGHSAMAQRYALASLEEARAYLDHPVLGARLRECSALVLAMPDRTVHEIFGSPDDLKFHSSMTLFHRAAPAEPVFGQCLRQFFAGQEDASTLARL